MDVTALASHCSRDGIEGCQLERGVVVFGNYKYGRDSLPPITLASFFSLSTSVGTSGTSMPAARPGGLSNLQGLQARRDIDARSARDLTVSSCFFLAFMMLGSVA